MAGWYLNYLGRVSMMLLLAWASTRLYHEPEVRTFLFATGTYFAYLMNAFFPIAVYPAKDAPKWRIGAKLYLGFAVFSTLLFIIIYFAFKWEDKKTRNRSTVEE
ncbi:hypothetical protein PV10_07693 [Exophiala mesophila]|uniref:Uncharacterized protein n=1 Tax=Exophiala mesophila TaxID=212818 RepID=A0A0D1Z8K4_EXOME|nr:uncharacterized protein PV10_07693 [Exophiala mesophila]KIV90384.1 hypothetical protein PV10_07693 [Exophiala mesophila]